MLRIKDLVLHQKGAQYIYPTIDSLPPPSLTEKEVERLEELEDREESFDILPSGHDWVMAHMDVQQLWLP